jgi:hypothetical protein
MSGDGIYYWLSGEGKYKKKFEWPNEVNGVPKRNGPGNVAGCGLLLNAENKLFIFFTFNGILLGKFKFYHCLIAPLKLCYFAGKQMPISPSVNCLYPTLEMWYVSVEANFGNDPAKPFQYNI